MPPIADGFSGQCEPLTEALRFHLDAGTEELRPGTGLPHKVVTKLRFLRPR